jgi:hypothetical protein
MWHIDTWRTYGHVSKIHVAMWPRAFDQVAMWPRALIHVVDFGHVDFRHAATWSHPVITCVHMPHVLIHVTMWPRVINTRYDMTTWRRYTRKCCHVH